MNLLSFPQKFLKNFYSRLILLATSLLLATSPLASTNGFAAQATLSWAAPTNADGTPLANLSGYKLYAGTSSGNYAQQIDVGDTTSYTLGSLNDGATYYFAVAAYDAAGHESGLSNEASKTFPAAPVTYTVTATAGSGGTITPSGNVTVSQATNGISTINSITATQGSNVSLAITPVTGYRIAGVTVDGVSVGAVTAYTFSNVTANHAISATFAANTAATFAISASAGTGGTISPAGASSVNSGGSLTYTISPASGYKIAGVTVDGISVGSVSSYTFSNVNAGHTISASFTATATAGQVVFATNCGGSAFTDSAGVTYRADAQYSGGNASSTTASISGTVDDGLYKTWRSGTLSYNVPLANGNYSVTLKFADNLSASGLRVFDVLMEGTTVVSRLDIYAKVGKNAAYDVTIPVSVTDGVLNVAFKNLVGYAKVNAIVVKTR